MLACLALACSSEAGGGPDDASNEGTHCNPELQSFTVQVVGPGPGTGAHACGMARDDDRVWIVYADDADGSLNLDSGDEFGFKIDTCYPVRPGWTLLIDWLEQAYHADTVNRSPPPLLLA